MVGTTWYTLTDPTVLTRTGGTSFTAGNSDFVGYEGGRDALIVATDFQLADASWKNCIIHISTHVSNIIKLGEILFNRFIRI